MSSLVTAATETAAGTIMGTVGYMSPEQVRGETVKPASDIFSLGCVLYEMATGQSAFVRASASRNDGRDPQGHTTTH